MIIDFISEQLKRARYELIDAGSRYYGEIRNLKGVWATGKTLEECRENLLDVLEGWLVLHLKKNLPIPDLHLRTSLQSRAKAKLNV